MTMDQKQSGQNEEGIDIPYERINPDTLRKMIEEFVTREWADPADSGYTLEGKVTQVLRQLEAHTAKVVFDTTTETWNIVASRQ